MTSPPDPHKIPDWVQDFLGSPRFKSAVDTQVQSFRAGVDKQVKDVVDTQVKDLRSTVDKLKADAEAAVNRDMVAQVPISGLKGEVAGLNAAVNGIKAEVNLFDPIKLLGIQDRIDAFWKDRLLAARGKTVRSKDLDPEKLLEKIEALEDDTIPKLSKDVSAMQTQVDGAHTKANGISKNLGIKPDLPEMRKDLAKLEKHAAWAKNRINALGGSKDPAKDHKMSRRAPSMPSVHQLERQEEQLRKAILKFVRLVESAAPEMKSFSSQINKIERELQR
ncbi:hypothetical protein ACH4TV_17780 [Streptomyces sp. NPDC020898]|uniref:hypothetical protein n=1 Tax=Streptomyces sp. NPDC020898 TaxID=3365101 RepID=UPI00379E25E2